MIPMRLLKWMPVCVLAAVLNFVAHPASAQSDSVSGTWGVTAGGSFAGIDLSINGGAIYVHNGTINNISNISGIQCPSWSNPSFSLFGKSTTLWQLNANGYIQRDASNANTGPLAAARVIWGSTTFKDCFTGGVGFTGASCSFPKTTVATLTVLHGTFATTVGPIPLTVDGKITADMDMSSSGTATLRTSASGVDRTLSTITLGPVVRAEGWVALGVPVAAQASIGGKVDFIKGSLAVNGIAERSVACPPSNSSCGAHNAAYLIRTIGSGAGKNNAVLTAFSGQVDAKVTVAGITTTKNLFKWTGPSFGNTQLWNNQKFPAFPTTY